MLATLRKNILATLTYYDVLGYSLTTFEVRKYLLNYHVEKGGQKVTLSEVSEKLTELERDEHIQNKKGFWSLAGRTDLADERITKEKISIAKLKRMRRLIAWLRYLPFIRMISATGSLSLRHGSRTSDWDMFVVLEEKALFTGRLILTVFLQLIGKRRHGKKIVDRACLNYFTGSESLCVRTKDWYASHEYQVMIPLFQTFRPDAFYRANDWLLQFRSQTHLPVNPHRLQLSDTHHTRQVRNILEKIFFSSWLEKGVARLQKEKIARNPSTTLQGACIIADDHSLVFFPKPRGPKVFELFKERLRF